MFSFKSVFFAGLALAATASAATPSTEELLSIIDGLERRLAKLEKSEGTEDRLRKLKKNKKDDSPDSPSSPSSPSLDFKDRNICYSDDSFSDTLDIWVSCKAEAGDYYAPFCGNSSRRLLTEEDVQEATRDLSILECADGYTETIEQDIIEFATFPIGAIEIEEMESLMIELTATTLNTVGYLTNHSSEYFSGLTGEAISGVYVTATMWEDCDNITNCVDSEAPEIYPEPITLIPINVVGINNYTQNLTSPSIQGLNMTFFETNTVKLFFPDSMLTDHTKYFITLSFLVAVRSAVFSCTSLPALISTFANATLGPYIIDAEIVTDGDFGNCGWIDDSVEGCGLFDKLSGSEEVDCSM